MLDCIGVSIWQMAVEPCNTSQLHQNLPRQYENGHVNHTNGVSSDNESTEGEDDDDSVVVLEDDDSENGQIAFACDDGGVRIYTTDEKNMTYKRSLPRVSGETAAPESQSADI